MTDRIAELLKRTSSIEDDLEQELDRRRDEFGYRIAQGRVNFDREAAAERLYRASQSHRPE